MKRPRVTTSTIRLGDLLLLVLLVTIAALAVYWVRTSYDRFRAAKRCESKGGIYIQTLADPACVKLERVE